MSYIYKNLAVARKELEQRGHDNQHIKNMIRCARTDAGLFAAISLSDSIRELIQTQDELNYPEAQPNYEHIIGMALATPGRGVTKKAIFNEHSPVPMADWPESTVAVEGILNYTSMLLSIGNGMRMDTIRHCRDNIVRENFARAATMRPDNTNG